MPRKVNLGTSTLILKACPGITPGTTGRLPGLGVLLRPPQPQYVQRKLGHLQPAQELGLVAVPKFLKVKVVQMSCVFSLQHPPNASHSSYANLV